MSRRGRKKQYINKITSKDKNMLRAFRNTGVLSTNHLRKDLKIAQQRIVNFQRDGYIQKKQTFNAKHKELETVFHLTKKGRDLVYSQMNLQHCYRSPSARHDLAIANKYFSLTEKEQRSWMTEGDLRELFSIKTENNADVQYAYKNRELSATDAAYTTEGGTTISFEVITKNYKYADIESKVNFSEVLNMKPEIIRI